MASQMDGYTKFIIVIYIMNAINVINIKPVNIMRFKKLASALLCTSALTFSYQALAAGKVDRIIIEGNKRVETSTVESYLAVKHGEEFSAAKEEQSIHALYATSLFDNVKVSYDAGVVRVFVEETPLVVKVLVKGNSKIGTKKIDKEILTKSGRSFSQKEIQHDADKITEMYKRSGRFAVTVVPQIEKLPNNRVKVIFNVSEGPKTAVKKIRFVGNGSYTSNQLKSIILTKETAWYRFLDTNDTYDPDRMEYDKELLKRFYQSLGYADFQVLSANAELAPTKDHFIITYAINEGQKYNFGTVDLQNGLSDVKSSSIKSLIKVKKGRKFNAKLIEQTEDKITEWLGNRGYPQIYVTHQLDKNPTTRIANVIFVVEKADKVFVGKINIRGNLKTRDKVIRREFSIAEGDVLNRSYLDKAERNLRNLDYFEKVNIKYKPTNQPSRYDVDVDVQEKSTSSIGLEGGYNTSSGPFGRVSFDDRNVLGTGKYFSTSMQVAKRSTSYSVGITEPHFLDKNLSLGTSLFYSHTGSGHVNHFWGDSNSYTLNTTGGRVSLGYDLSDDLQHSMFYTLKRDNLSVSKNQDSLFIKEQVGKYTTSAVGHSLTLNKADNMHMPKNGYIASVTQEYAGAGGDIAYLKHEGSLAMYNSFVDNKYTLKLSGETGDIHGMKGNSVKIIDRFNLGDYSMRGFAARGIGPRDKFTGEALGGQKFYSFTAELQFPIGMPEEFNLAGAVFTDVGGLWGFDVPKTSTYDKKNAYDTKTPRVSYGVGLIWNTRFAPIRIDYALRLRKQKYDEVQPWHIRFSTNF